MIFQIFILRFDYYHGSKSLVRNLWYDPAQHQRDETHVQSIRIISTRSGISIAFIFLYYYNAFSCACAHNVSSVLYVQEVVTQFI